MKDLHHDCQIRPRGLKVNLTIVWKKKENSRRILALSHIVKDSTNRKIRGA